MNSKKPAPHTHASADLTREINRIFHDEEAACYDARHPEVLEGDWQWWERTAARHILPLAKDRGPLRVLDLGTGTGFVAGVLRNILPQGTDIVAYDMSRRMLERAQAKLPGTPAVQGDAEQLPFTDSSFDAVVVNAVLHHLPDYGRCLAEARRVLSFGGLLIIAHEQNGSFFKNPAYRLLAMGFKLLGGRMRLSSELAGRVNAALMQKGLIEKPLTQGELMGLVDTHSPIEQSAFGIDTTKGFVIDDLLAGELSGMTLLEQREYSTFFLRPSLRHGSATGTLLRLVGRLLLRDRGPLFSLVLQKPRTYLTAC